MNENSANRLPTGLIWLLIYQWILVLASLLFAVPDGIAFFRDRDYVFLVYPLVLACWVTAISYASIGMTRRNTRAFLVGTICHGLLAVLGTVGLIGFCSLGVLPYLGPSHDGGAWAPLFLLFALMWLPFALMSGWGFFYLQALRKNLFS